MDFVVKYRYRFLLIQCIILMCLFGAMIYRAKNPNIITIGPDMLSSDYAEYNNGEYFFDELLVNCAEDEEKEILVSKSFPLKADSYTLYIDYETNTYLRFGLFDGTRSNAYLPYDEGRLRREYTTEMFKFKTSVDLDSFCIKFFYQPYGYLKIRNISIASNNETLKRWFLFVFVLFFFTDICFVDRDKVSKNKDIILYLTGITILASLPLFTPFVAKGHDLHFALLRIEGVYQELKNGHIPVRILGFLLNGYGYPVSIYYGDISLYFPALLRMSGFNIIQTWKIFIVVINALTTVICYLCFLHVNPDKRTAAVISLLYVISPYRLVNLYVRAACGEFVATAFIPLIAMSVYKIYTEELTKDLIRKYSSILALGMSAVLCTHILSTEILVFTLAITAIVLIKKTVSIPTMKALSLGCVKMILISAYFLVPFLDYYFSCPTFISENISKETVRYQGYGVNMSDFLSLGSFTGFGLRLPFTPGIVLILALLYAIYMLVVRKTDRINVYFVSMSLILMFMSSNLYPWNSLAARYRIGNAMAQIQFPFRLITMVTILLAFLLGRLLYVYADAQTSKILRYIIIVISIVTTSLFADSYNRAEDFVRYSNTSNLNTMDVMGGEFILSGTDRYADNSYWIKENNDGVVTGTINNGTDMTITCNNEREAREIVLPRYNYKNYHVFDMAGNEYAISNAQNNIVSFTLPAGFVGEIYLKYIEPVYWRIAEIISLMSVIGLIIHALMSKRHG